MNLDLPTLVRSKIWKTGSSILLSKLVLSSVLLPAIFQPLVKILNLACIVQAQGERSLLSERQSDNLAWTKNFFLHVNDSSLSQVSRWEKELQAKHEANTRFSKLWHIAP